MKANLRSKESLHVSLVLIGLGLLGIVQAVVFADKDGYLYFGTLVGKCCAVLFYGWLSLAICSFCVASKADCYVSSDYTPDYASEREIEIAKGALDGAVSWQQRWEENGDPVRWCKRCNAFRPPRAHHCAVCDKCVDCMDHHCGWVGNCIGKQNLKAFLLCLMYVSLCLLFSCVSVFVEAFIYLKKHRVVWVFVLLLLLALVMGAVLLVLVIGVMLDQVALLLENLTRVEERVLDCASAEMLKETGRMMRLRNHFDMGAKANVRAVFESPWLFPTVPRKDNKTD